MSSSSSGWRPSSKVDGGQGTSAVGDRWVTVRPIQIRVRDNGHVADGIGRP
jgi:hypothetical protein